VGSRVDMDGTENLAPHRDSTPGPSRPKYTDMHINKINKNVGSLSSKNSVLTVQTVH